MRTKLQNYVHQLLHNQFERRRFFQGALRNCCYICAAFAFITLSGVARQRFGKAGVHAKSLHSDAVSATQPLGGAELVGVFQFRTGTHEPQHLHVLQSWREDLVYNGSAQIHSAHVLGLPHFGVWMHIVDSESRILVLQRGITLKTCAGMWGLLGEHQLGREAVETLADRALDEELGMEFRRVVDVSKSLIGSPVWYHREYDDGRIDRQATWLWFVRLKVPGEYARLSPDAEVAALHWVSLSELEDWIRRRPADFCHETIRSLLLFGLPHVRAALAARRAT